VKYDANRRQAHRDSHQDAPHQRIGERLMQGRGGVFEQHIENARGDLNNPAQRLPSGTPANALEGFSRF